MKKNSLRKQAIDANQVLRLLRERPGSPRYLVRSLGLPIKRRQELNVVLQQLLAAGDIVRQKGGVFGLPKTGPVVRGRFQQHQPGYGFVIPEEEKATDLYIPAAAFRDAMPGDTVEARVVSTSSGRSGDKRRRGQIVRVVTRLQRQVVGALQQASDGRFYLEPDGGHGLRSFWVNNTLTKGTAKLGEKVVARILEWPQAQQPGLAEITEVLGAAEVPGTDITALIRQYELPDKFTPQSLEQAKRIAVEPEESLYQGRQDLRHLRIVTIDGADARDFDDAVCCDAGDDGGWRLGVHIADVGHYLHPGTPLDLEAQVRGTSVYFPDRVLHMLPEALSCGVCSLVPQRERLTMTAWVWVDPQGRISRTEFKQSVIKSAARLTYDQVEAVLSGSAQHDNPALAFAPELLRLEAVSRALRSQRQARGSLDFDLPDPRVVLGPDGRVQTIEKRVQLSSHKLIEDCMIAANEAVAEELQRRDLPSLYRVHAQPAGEKLEQLKVFLAAYGYVLAAGKPKQASKAFQQLLNSWQDKPECAMLNSALLRSMKLAVYSDHNIGHFGLGSECYTHFTSPIRRYPDLVVHRVLKLALAAKPLTGEARSRLAEQMRQWGEELSLAERRAEKAEREAVKIKQLEFLQGLVGQIFSGRISMVAPHGFYVELDEHFAEGLVVAGELKDDYYFFNEARRILVGSNFGRFFQTGNPVRVKVERVDMAERSAIFKLIPDHETRPMEKLTNPPRVVKRTRRKTR